ncbi:MAG: hypothetical protein E7054_07470 [Lentisphaerae bacterium]|nr:hypothetical protein [Lentisphaerota bacterium]
MYKPILRRIFLKDSDGGITPFDPENLLTRLAGAFQSANQESECYVADDIVLALEYTLRRAPRPELVFSEGEIDAAVIRILESSGFPEAAQAFRASGSREQLLQLSTTGAALQEFLSAHLGCSQERLVKIAEKCSTALQTLNIEAASLHLILELARHYERETAEADLRHAAPVKECANTVLTRQDIAGLLPKESAELLKNGVLQISGVSPVFPGIRFFFSMEKFALQHNFTIPVTELELYPALYRTANILENARKAISDRLALPEDPPCLMTIPDMFDFLYRMVGCTKADAMAAELAGILCSEFKAELYQLSFD